MDRIGSWFRLARAPLAAPTVAAVLVGTLYAVHDARPFRWAPLAPALAAALFAHLGASVLRDVFDHLAAGDAGPGAGAAASDLPALLARREVAAPEALLLAAIFWGLAFVSGALLVPLSGSVGLFLLLGALVLAVLYAAPPIALSRLGHGLGEAAAFLGLGVLPVAGGYGSQAGVIPLGVVVASLPMAFAATAVVYAGDLVRVDRDRASGRMSAAVVLGPRRALAGYAALLLFAALALVVDVRLGEFPRPGLAGLLGLVPCAVALWRLRSADSVEAYRTLGHATWIGATICGLLISAGFVAGFVMGN